MFTMIKVLLLISLVGFIYGQLCNFDEYQECARSGSGQNVDFRKKKQEVRANVEKCLLDAGCQKPSDKRKGGGSEQSRQCRKQIHDKITADVQQCVQAKFPDFKFPARKRFFLFSSENKEENGNTDENIAPRRPREADADRFRGSKNRRQHGSNERGRNFDRLVDSLCKDESAKSEAKQCLAQIKPVVNVQNKTDFRAMREQRCQKKAECLQKLTPECQKQRNDTLAGICRCAKEKIVPQSSQLEESLKKCQSETGSPTSDSETSGKNPKGTGRGGFGRRSLADRIVGRFCKRQEICGRGKGRP